MCIEQAPTPMLRQPEANVIDVLKEIDTKAPNLITDMKLLLNDVYAKVKELAELDGFRVCRLFVCSLISYLLDKSRRRPLDSMPWRFPPS